MSDSTSGKKRERPLSPHLQVYQPQLTSMTSIFHRVSGVGLVLGLAILSFALYFAANDPRSFNVMMNLLATPFGLIIITGFVAAMSYHFCSGIRHLIFDTGAMLDLKSAYAAGYAVITGAVALTLVVMAFICNALL